MSISVADLCDQYEDQIRIAHSVFRDFGGAVTFAGPIVTLKVDRDFLLIKHTLSQPGNGQVLVIDGAETMECALLGDRLAAMAKNNGWSGMVINGCVRDSRELQSIDIGIKALNTCPRRPALNGGGEKNTAVEFAGVVFQPGDILYADSDGVIVSEQPLAGQ